MVSCESGHRSTPCRQPNLRDQCWYEAPRGPTTTSRVRTKPEHDDGDLATRMSQIVADINESVAGRQVLNAIQHAREQDMYQPHYLASEPYLRLTLRKLNFGLSSVSDIGEEDDGQSGDPLLLVHRSGDCSSPSRFGC